MKLAVIGANGKAGKLIVKEAVNRGLDVTAVVRGDNTTVAQEADETHPNKKWAQCAHLHPPANPAGNP